MMKVVTSRVFLINLATCSIPLFVLPPLLAWADDIDRPGVGQWCYAPVHEATQEEKASFVADISRSAILAEQKWGVPAPIIAGMTIVESGYGLTRLALKSNNILAFKWPGTPLARNAIPFTLWCQPTNGTKADKGNVYPAFTSRADAINFVAWRLKESSYYAVATSTYQRNLHAGMDLKTAAKRWLVTIASHYNYDPPHYIVDVEKVVNDPLEHSPISLWNLRP